MFRLQDNVPEIYVNESRDFQLICRMMDAIQGSTKYKIDSLIHTSNTKECNASLLQHLKYKLGFFDDVDLTDEQLRFVLMGFPYIMRYKGSKKAIEDTMNLYFRLMNIPVEKKDIDIDNVNYKKALRFADAELKETLEEYVLEYQYSYALYHIEKASLTLRVNLLDDCISACEAAIALNPNIVDSYRILGYAQLQKEDKENARANLQKAIDMGDENAKKILDTYFK